MNFEKLIYFYLSFLFAWHSIIHSTPLILQSFHLRLTFFLTIKKVQFFSVRLILITLVITGAFTSFWAFYFLACFWNLGMKVFPSHSWFIFLDKLMLKILISLNLHFFPFLLIFKFHCVMFDLLKCFFFYLFFIYLNLFFVNLFFFLFWIRIDSAYCLLKIF